MKVLVLLNFLIFITWQLTSCQAKPSIKIIFESNSKDTATASTATKKYNLKKKAINSDFNYSKLEDIDGSTESGVNLKTLMPIFEPITGQFNYYQFIATFKGRSFDEIDRDFHDILIIKTDNNNKIIDAFQYTLEWAEPPLQDDLYRFDNKGLILENDLDINHLKLTHKDFWNEKERISKESGHILLK